MENIQLFLNIDTSGVSNDWNVLINASLSQLISSDKVLVIGKDPNEVQLNLSYNFDAVSLNEIQRHIEGSGAALTDMNIHFSSGITGVSDPYGASGISIAVEKKLKKLKGVLGVGISSTGTIKVHLDYNTPDKQVTVQEIINILSFLNPQVPLL